MSRLLIQATSKTPLISFNDQNGDFDIKGMSCSEYAFDFYKPVFEWVEEYIKSPADKTTLNIQLKYFNTSSAKCILQLLERVAMLLKKEQAVEVNWFYEKDDEQMITDGENYSVLLGFPFKLHEIK
jgi:hypothetical protein